MALLSFDASTVAPSKAFDPVPAGWYDAKIIASEIKPTANGAGTRLNLTFELIGGEHNGRKVFEGLNIKHTSEKAQQISQEQLSAICHALNIMKLNNSEQLHGHPLKIKVKVKPADTVNGYDARNEINGYESITHRPLASGAAGTAAPAKGAAAPTKPAAQGFAKPAAATAAPAKPAVGFGKGKPAAAKPVEAEAAQEEAEAVADAEQPWESEAQADAPTEDGPWGEE